MSSPVIEPSREKRLLDKRTTSATANTADNTGQKVYCIPIIRPRFVSILRNAHFLAVAVVCAATAQRFDPRSSTISKSSTSTSQRVHASKINRHPYRPPLLREIAQLGTEAQDFVVLQLSQQKALERITSQFSCRLQGLYRPQIFNDPQPPLFLIALIIYAFAITAFRYSHRKDRYQDLILWISVALGLVGACLTEDPVLELKSYLVWSVILALALSSLMHRVLGLFAAGEVREE